MKNMGC